MNKENLGLELIATRYEGIERIKIEVECEEGFDFTHTIEARFEIVSSFHSKETLEERQKLMLSKVRKFLSMRRVVVTVNGIGDSYHDERAFYRISSTFDNGVEVRPFRDNQFQVLHTEHFDSERKATNYILKVINEVVQTIKENTLVD